MATLYLEGISISEIENLIRTVVEEVITKEQSISEQKKLPSESNYLSRKETSKLLKVSLVTLNNWANTGVLTPFRVGNKRILYKREDVEKALLKINQKSAI